MSLNLLPNQAKFQVEKMRAIALTRKVLTIFLVVWVMIVLIIFGILLGSKWWLDKENGKYQSVVADFLQSSNEIVTSQTIKFRTKLLGKVLTDRFEYSEAFNLVGTIFDSKAIIKDFELKEKSFFVMTVTAADTQAMKDLESRVAEINKGLEPKISKIVIKSASFTKTDQLWVVVLEVYLK